MQDNLLDVQRILVNAWSDTGEPQCLEELCRMLTQRDMLSNALPYLEQLSAALPEDPSVLHNLGITLHACGRSAEGMQILEKCLQIAPHRIMTVCQLARIRHQTGDVRSSRQLLTEAQRRYPDDVEIRELLTQFAAPSF